MVKSSVQFVTSGTYQRALVYQDNMTWVANTEDEVDGVAAAIAGDVTKDTMYSWIRAKIYVNNNVAEHMGFEWALIKCASGDALQDLNSAADMEKLMKESRIFARDVQYYSLSRGSVKPIRFELFNVKLNLGDELRLVVRPLCASAGASMYYIGLIEWRQVGE